VDVIGSDPAMDRKGLPPFLFDILEITPSRESGRRDQGKSTQSPGSWVSPEVRKVKRLEKALGEGKRRFRSRGFEG
jgi:hypothetical protein